MSPIVHPLPPRRQRPDPPLAEVEVAEEERLLQLRGEVEQVGDLGLSGYRPAASCGAEGVSKAKLPFSSSSRTRSTTEPIPRSTCIVRVTSWLP